LLDGPAPEPTALTLEEQRLIARIDEVLSHGQIDDRLLPRASAIVPQLMALLRQADASLAAIAQRIAQDAPLAAEVLRAAAAAAHGGGAVQDIANAVQRIGATGVQQAVARVVFRPMYSSSAGSLGARAAPRLWQWSERSSEAAAEQARAAGLPAFDGYLAGLLHGTGWTILLRIADRSAIGLKLPLSQVAAAALDKRAHRLFGLAAQRWQITPGFNALGDEASASPLAQSALPLGQCLRRAEAMVLLQRVAPQPVLATP
jgi:HD-like signal output (HDOD) protein